MVLFSTFNRNIRVQFSGKPPKIINAKFESGDKTVKIFKNPLREDIRLFNEYFNQNSSDKVSHEFLIEREYLAFSKFFQDIFISEYGYIVDTGNYRTVNAELIELVKEKIEKHPILWRLFFMVA